MTYCVLWLTWPNNNPLIIAQDVMPPCKDRAQLLHASPTQGDLLAGQNISHSMSDLDILYFCAVDHGIATIHLAMMYHGYDASSARDCGQSSEVAGVVIGRVDLR